MGVDTIPANSDTLKSRPPLPRTEPEGGRLFSKVERFL